MKRIEAKVNAFTGPWQCAYNVLRNSAVGIPCGSEFRALILKTEVGIPFGSEFRVRSEFRAYTNECWVLIMFFCYFDVIVVSFSHWGFKMTLRSF